MLRHRPHINHDALSINGIRRSTVPVPHPTPGVWRGVAHLGVKISVTALLAALVFVGLAHVGGTISYLSDSERSLGNIFKADPLEFTVELATTSVDVTQGDHPVVPVMEVATTSEPVQYFVTAVKTGGDDALCNAVHILTTAPLPYDGFLLAIHTATTTDTGPWAFTFWLDGTPIPNTSCTVDLVYQGWNANASYQRSFHVTEKVSLTLFAPDVPVAAVAPATALVIDPPTEAPLADTSTTTPDAPSADPVVETPSSETPPTE